MKGLRVIFSNNILYQRFRSKYQAHLYNKECQYYNTKLNGSVIRGDIVNLVKKRIKKKVVYENLNIILYAEVSSTWEFVNFPDELSKLGSVRLITVDNALTTMGAGLPSAIACSFQDDIKKNIRDKKTNIFITCLSVGYGVDKKFIKKLNQKNVITLFFNLDDDTKFSYKENSEFYGPRAIASEVDVFLTSSSNSIKKYIVEGGRAIFSPEGANPELFFPIQVKNKYDVVFIGALYGIRKRLIEFLKRKNINIIAFGHGSPNGIPSFEEMNQIWNESKIVLGHGGIGYSNELRHLKGRDFEAIMSGTCYITTRLPELEEIFQEDKNIILYDTFEECAEKIKYLLNNSEQISIIKSNVLKIRKQHTWENRFLTVFRELGIINKD
jgi:spore maturation protein CgeB